MSLDNALASLDIEVDKRLYELKKSDLLNLISELIKYKDKKLLAKLISDNLYFTTNDLIKSLEKKQKSLLFKILNEPENESDLRQPIANWIKNIWNYEAYDFEVPLPNSRRKIDVVGCKFSKYAGFVGEDSIVAVEIKTSPSRSALDSAFSQAKDYIDCSDYAYVAVSPYVFLKYSNVILNKIERYDDEIGLLLTDKLRVVSEIYKAKSTKYNNNKYEQVQNYFKQKV